MVRIDIVPPDPVGEPPDGWRPTAFWLEFAEGVARAFRRVDDAAVRVEGPAVVPTEVPLPLWTGVGGRTWPFESQVRRGVTGTVGEEELVVRMPERGLARRARQLQLVVGSRRYTFTACGWPMSGRAHLVREGDGSVRYLVTYARDRQLVADDADAVERALVTVLAATNSRERVVHNPLLRF